MTENHRQIGDYILLSRLAVGGQSEVFLAYKPGPWKFSRVVVLKILPTHYHDNDMFIDLFYKEAFVSARFAHPNVITVHDAKFCDGEHFMIMDFVAGQTVADIAQRGFKQNNILKLNHIVHIIAEACEGLHYVHSFRDLDDTPYSITHCDVSPQNIMVTYHGNIKVFDFGIARIDGFISQSDNLAGGKYAYMSPEQCRGEDVDARSDIFSLGVILYELVTGTRLFRRKSKAEVIKALLEDPIRPPSELRDDIPLFLESSIMKAIERDPNQRYQSAAQFRDDLKQFLAMQSDSRARQEVGHYVAKLFEQERKNIATSIKDALEAIPEEALASSEIPRINLPEVTVYPIDEELKTASRNRTEWADTTTDRELYLVASLVVAVIAAFSFGYLYFA